MAKNCWNKFLIYRGGLEDSPCFGYSRNELWNKREDDEIWWCNARKNTIKGYTHYLELIEEEKNRIDELIEEKSLREFYEKLDIGFYDFFD